MNAMAQDFEVTTVTDGLERPVGLAVAPDGRIFVTEQGGRVRIITDAGLLDEPFLEIDVLDEGESGLVGIALDPNFTDNHWVYVFASVSDTEQQILRYTDTDNHATEPAIIRAGLPTNGQFHNGGALKFGPDGKLYFTVGDTGEANLAQSLTSLAGKVCRINPDGTVPDDNPFETPTGAPRAIYALGFRNPFRMTIAPDGRVFVADVGSGGDQRREELNIVYPGQNYGWPILEGFGTTEQTAQYTDPVFAYNELGQAATGVVYYTGTQFPVRFRGNLFQLEYVFNRLFRLVLDGDELVSDKLLLEVGGGPVDLIQDIDGTLLVTEYFTGQVSRITYIGQPDDPNDPNLFLDPNEQGDPNHTTDPNSMSGDEDLQLSLGQFSCGTPVLLCLLTLTWLTRPRR